MTTRDQQQDCWMTKVREAAASESAPIAADEWRDHDVMHALAEEACELRTLGDDAAWKAPFNRFRRLFLVRNHEALQHFADGTGDDAFWLGFMHFAFEAEA